MMHHKISDPVSQKRDLKKNQSSGFTIVELLIATAVFSMVLLLCATAVVQVGRMFYKGTIINNVQNTSRAVVDDISGAIQFGGKDSTIIETQRNVSFTGPSSTMTLPIHAVCLVDVRYSYFLQNDTGVPNSDFKLPHVLWKDRIGSGDPCIARDVTTANPGGTSGQELLGDSMRLSKFKITKPTTGSIWKLDFVIAYGATNDVFTDGTFTACTASQLGGQFCAVSAINTYVAKRL